MEIRFHPNYYRKSLVVEAENVRIEEDVEERIYKRDENGEIIPGEKVDRDVSTGAIDMIVQVLDYMMYVRERKYDSSHLIRQLFERLDADVANDLAESLHNEYKY